MKSNSVHVDARLTKIETETEGIQKAVEALIESVTKLNDKIDRSAKTPWSIIFGFSTVVIGLGTLMFNYQNNKIDTLSSAQLEQKQELSVRQETISSILRETTHDSSYADGYRDAYLYKEEQNLLKAAVEQLTKIADKSK